MAYHLALQLPAQVPVLVPVLEHAFWFTTHSTPSFATCGLNPLLRDTFTALPLPNTTFTHGLILLLVDLTGFWRAPLRFVTVTLQVFIVLPC